MSWTSRTSLRWKNRNHCPKDFLISTAHRVGFFNPPTPLRTHFVFNTSTLRAKRDYCAVPDGDKFLKQPWIEHIRILNGHGICMGSSLSDICAYKLLIILIFRGCFYFTLPKLPLPLMSFFNMVYHLLMLVQAWQTSQFCGPWFNITEEVLIERNPDSAVDSQRCENKDQRSKRGVDNKMDSLLNINMTDAILLNTFK